VGGFLAHFFYEYEQSVGRAGASQQPLNAEGSRTCFFVVWCHRAEGFLVLPRVLARALKIWPLVVGGRRFLKCTKMCLQGYGRPFEAGRSSKSAKQNESPKRKRPKSTCVEFVQNGAANSCFCPAAALMIAVARSLRLVAGAAGASAAAAPKSGASNAPATMTAGSVMTGDTWGGARARAPKQ
jgi:hypothetical protein